MDYGPITLDQSYLHTSVLLAIVGVAMKTISVNTLVYLFIAMTMRICSVTATEKVSILMIITYTTLCVFQDSTSYINYAYVRSHRPKTTMQF